MTTDELFALGLERTRILAAMIDNGRSWYLGRRRRRPEEMISGYFDPKRGLGIDYFRKTIRHLANGGFKKVNMKSDAAVAFRKGNEHVLALLREMEPLLAQHVGKEDANAYRLALFFFRSGQDMFFDILPRFEPILRPTIKKMKVEAFCIDSLQRYLGAVARAFAIREAQLTGTTAAVSGAASSLPLPAPDLSAVPGLKAIANVLAGRTAEEVAKTPAKRCTGVSICTGYAAHPGIKVEYGMTIIVQTRERKRERFKFVGGMQWEIVNRFLASLKAGDDHSAGHYPVAFGSEDYNRCHGYCRAFIDRFVERQPAAVRRGNRRFEAKARVRVELVIGG